MKNELLLISEIIYCIIKVNIAQEIHEQLKKKKNYFNSYFDK